MSATLWLVELEAYDPDTASVRTLRYASGAGHTTTPSETPANTWYDARVVNPLDSSRSLFGGARTSGRARSSLGDIKLNNADGGLDALLGYAFDGRDVTVRRGEVGAAYPSGFPVQSVGTVDFVETRRTEILIRTRDPLFALQSPLQTTTYDGDNVLPDGVEGVAGDLKKKPKPFALGVVKNVAPPCVNTAKLIYQPADVPDTAAILVNGVYDSGIELGAAHYLVAGSGGWLSASGDGATFATKADALPLSGIVVQCSVAGGGYSVLGDNTGRIYYSADGASWTTVNPGPGVFGNVEGLAYDGTTYVLVGSGVSGHIYTSTNLTTWTLRTSTFGAGDTVHAIVWSGTQFVCVGDGGKCATSPDGTTWTARTTGAAVALRGIAYGDGTYVACGDSGALYASADAVTWSSQTSGATGAPSINRIVFGGDQFLWGADGGQIGVSPDGTTWTARTDMFPPSFDITVTGYGGGVFFVGGADAAMWTSVDCVAWSSVALGLETAFRDDIGTVLYRDDLTPAPYATLADLLDNDLAPLAGMYRAYLDGGLIRLGFPPAGLITCDVTVGATAADRTAAQLWTGVLSRAGYTSADWSASDVTALDTANSAECGLWIGPDERLTTAEALDLIAQTVGAAWWASSDGTFRIRQLTAPSGTADIEITANDMLEPLALVPTSDPAQARPTYRTVVRYARKYAVQATGVALGVTDARRAELAAAWREVESVDATVQTAHLLARESIVETLFATALDAQTEATRLQALHGTRRQVYEVTVPLTATTAVIDLFDVVKITHPRFSLSSGKLTRVLSVAPDAAQRKTRWQLWG